MIKASKGQVLSLLLDYPDATYGKIGSIVHCSRQRVHQIAKSAGYSQEVSFSVTREEADSYTITVDGLSGSFTVLAPPPGINWAMIGGIIAGVIVVGLLIFVLLQRRAY